MRRRLWFVAGLALAVLLGEVALRLAPYPTERLAERPQSWRLVDREGRLLREAVGTSQARATWVPLDGISPWVVQGTVAIEDQRFWSHPGIDGRAVARAVHQDLRAMRVVSGASTLTMQLARLLGDHPRSLGGKLAQAIDAVRLERVTDKQTVLEQYLNRAPYGAGTIGVEAASQRYFGKPSRQLSLAEGALLAGLPQAPSGHNPLRDPERARQRQRAVLVRMRELRLITPEEHARALREPLSLRSDPVPPDALHFTDHVLAHAPPTGLVHTTLDRDLQHQVERLARDHVAALRHGGLEQAAVVVLDNETCEVRAMVGSVDWWAAPDGSVNGATALRQPGSTLKPFTYALAFSGTRYSPASVVADIETRYLDADGELMFPHNYSERFSGPVLMGEALGRSLNVPAVRVANAVGLDELLETLRAAGFDSLDADAAHYGLGLTLGNGEVTLLELAQAYAAFARGGLTCRARVWDGQPEVRPERLFSEQVAWQVTDVLADEALRVRAFGIDNPLRMGMPIAVKTGTSTNWRDSWTVGYTPEWTVAVWAGDFGGRPMNQLSGAVGAGPLFARIARHLATRGAVDARPLPPRRPDGVEPVEVCALSGHLPGASCPHTRTVQLQPHQVPAAACDWHREVAIDRRNGLRASPDCPREHVRTEVFEVLPATYASWQASHTGTAPPARYSPLCPLDGVAADAVVVTAPRDGDRYLIEPGYDTGTQSVELTAVVDPPVPELTWLIDGRPVATTAWPYRAVWPLEAGQHRIEARAGDRVSDARTIVVHAPL